MDLIVPVYLNQRFVFDLVAMSQNGIATVTKISQTEDNRSEEAQKISTKFGLNDAFSSLLKIGLSGDKSTLKDRGASLASTEERVHTPSSLFFSLRRSMFEEGEIKLLGEGNCVSGDFVEFEAALSKSPLIEGLDAIIKFLDLASIFSRPEQVSKGQKSKVDGYNKLSEQLFLLSKEIKQGGSRDLIAANLPSNHTAVLTVEEQYLSDVTMADLVDGTFKVLGKVVRVVESSNDSISLLRKSALNYAPEAMSKLISTFQQLNSNQFALPEIKTEIKGPALQVLPIAIYS